jgi:hypothetical protein
MAEQPKEVITGLLFGDGGVQLGINGQVRSSLRHGQSGCPADMTMTEEPRGVRLRSRDCNVLVTWSHIRLVEYAQPVPPKPATAQK